MSADLPSSLFFRREKWKTLSEHAGLSKPLAVLLSRAEGSARRAIAPSCGVQYAAYDYVGTLREHGIRPSMSRPEIPTDNASRERFIGTLKRCEIYLKDNADFDDAHTSIGRFIDVAYNRQRLHSALGYVPPAEFEASLQERSLMPTQA